MIGATKAAGVSLTRSVAHHVRDSILVDSVAPASMATELARPLGFVEERVDTTGGFAAAFERALASSSGAVLDLAISPEAITPRQTLTQMRDAALASEKATA